MRIATVLFLFFALLTSAVGAQPAQAPPDSPKGDAPKAAPSEPEGKADAEAKTKAKAKPSRVTKRGGVPFYMGRPIAHVMGFEGADWLFRPEREQEEQPDAMLDALKIQPGQTVADVGAGAGYLSLRLARRVGPKGKVLATDLQPQMLQMLAANARTDGANNIVPIRCTPTDPKLPSAAVDLVLMVDVYHECSSPVATLEGLRKAIKPGGRLVLVEFRAEDPNVPIKPEHKMTLAQVRKEIEPQGFAFKESLEFLPWQHIIIFERPADEPTKPGSAEPKKAAPKEEAK